MATASAIFTAVTQTVLQQGSAPEFQGRVMSLFTIAWIGTTPAGGLVAGAVIDQFSARAALGMGAVTALLAGLGALTVSRHWAGGNATATDSTDSESCYL
jgi:MFS family permease